MPLSLGYCSKDITAQCGAGTEEGSQLRVENSAGFEGQCEPKPTSFETRDNGYMPMAPRGFVHQGQLDSEIKSAVRKLGPEVVHVAYRLGEDSTGEPSIFFRIVLTDAASSEDTLTETTGRIATILFDEVRPIENWRLHPYFNFRSESEQRGRRDPEWV
jgi:hypothetical protein